MSKRPNNLCSHFVANFKLMKKLRLWSKLWNLAKYYFYINPIMSNKNNPAPGDGLRSVRTTTLFRAVNFELYTKPVSMFYKFMVQSIEVQSIVLIF